MKLVAGERERVDVEFAHIDGDVAHGLHRVGVEGRTVRVGNGGELANGLDGADLVVGEHDRNECCRGVRVGCRLACVMLFKCAFKLGGVNTALRVDRQICDANAFGLKGLTTVQDGVVLDCAGHDVGDGAFAICVAEAARGSAQDPVVGFRAATGEVNLVGMLGAKEAGHGAACLSERDGGFARHAVDSARVAERAGEMGRHGFERARRERRGGRVVGIDVGHDVGHGRWSNLLAQNEEPEQGEGDRGDDHDPEGDLDSPALTVLAGGEDSASFFGR